jgi:hypothetical protein
MADAFEFGHFVAVVEGLPFSGRFFVGHKFIFSAWARRRNGALRNGISAKRPGDGWLVLVVAWDKQKRLEQSNRGVGVHVVDVNAKKSSLCCGPMPCWEVNEVRGLLQIQKTRGLILVPGKRTRPRVL